MPDEIVLTEASYRRLKQELDHLKGVKRAEIAEALRRARAYGDLSENFEYQAARRDQAILNGRIADLEQTLDIATVVPDDTGAGDGTAGLGCSVTVRDLDADDEWEYVLVDPVQADPINDRISVHSPVGQALYGKRPGDTVQVRIPAGIARYEILTVRRA
ncbi:MAG: transcription elongation factor GreA [Chthonomonadales bacterium]|nr:transcription elongation factor GreA [Chthonomonadales bacterium]